MAQNELTTRLNSEDLEETGKRYVAMEPEGVAKTIIKSKAKTEIVAAKALFIFVLLGALFVGIILAIVMAGQSYITGQTIITNANCINNWQSNCEKFGHADDCRACYGDRSFTIPNNLLILTGAALCISCIKDLIVMCTIFWVMPYLQQS